MYSPTLAWPETLAIIGFVHPLGPIFSIAEMQCRVFCEYLQKVRILPNQETMLKEIRAREKLIEEVSAASNGCATPMLWYEPYMYELAFMIDAQPPSIWQCLVKGDPELAWALAVGPCLPYEFRLQGPHTWEGARNAILSVWQRVIAATKTRAISSDSGDADCMGRRTNA